MSTVGDAINRVRSKVAARSSKFMADVCDLKVVTNAAGSSGGRTVSESTIATDIPCDYEPLSSPLERQIAAAGVTSASHKITMPSTAATQDIRPNYRIVVDARGDVPQLTFEHPTILSDSFDPFVTVAATLKAA